MERDRIKKINKIYETETEKKTETICDENLSRDKKCHINTAIMADNIRKIKI